MSIQLADENPPYFHFFEVRPPSFASNDLVLCVPQGINRSGALLEWYATQLDATDQGSNWNCFKEYFDFQSITAPNVCIVHEDLPLLYDPYAAKLEPWKTYIEALYDVTEIQQRIFVYFPQGYQFLVRRSLSEYIGRINSARLARDT